MNMFEEIGKLQEKYKSLINTNKVTKADICNLVIPFRDKYNLTDSQALSIVRDELTISQIHKTIKQRSHPITLGFSNNGETDHSLD